MNASSTARAGVTSFLKVLATEVAPDGVTVNALSIMGLLMLGAGNGCTIDISAEGAEAEAAVAGLVDLVDRKFDEDQ